VCFAYRDKKVVGGVFVRFRAPLQLVYMSYCILYSLQPIYLTSSTVISGLASIVLQEVDAIDAFN
jgi:hypothetical protein